MTPTERKKQLVAQGRVYRAEAVLAKDAVRTGLQPESLTRSALAQVAIFAISAFRNRSDGAPAGMNASTLLPLVMSGASAISKTKSLKPVLRSALIAGAIAGIVTLLAKRQQATPTDEIDRTG